MNKADFEFNRSLEYLTGIFGDRIRVDHPLAGYTTFGTGGAARLFIEIKSDDELASALKAVGQFNIPFFLLGGGSNVLIADSGFNGLVIKNSIPGLTREGNMITCGAGENLGDLVNFATENSLSGLEFATGIWGTVGGAIYGNAGAYGSDIGDVLRSAELIDRHGDVRTEKNPFLEFGYRSSVLKMSGEIVLRATFALKEGKKVAIQRRVDDIMAERQRKLPIEGHSAGCFFKNIPDKSQQFGKLSAGKLLEEVGAKEMQYGGARVFEKHANIIINDGTARSAHIIELAKRLKLKVKNKFGINLTEEVILLGDFEEEKI